jgi:hypothetical protein
LPCGPPQTLTDWVSLVAKRVRPTAAQRAIAIQIRAEGRGKLAICRDTDLSLYVVNKLLRDIDLQEAIEKVRLTEVIPKKLTDLMESNSLLVSVIEKLETRLTSIEAVARMTRKALHRIQVENTDLRVTRKSARQQLAKVKRDLWKARGY